MNHDPFEQWIFSDDPLTPQEAVSLQEHLLGCSACQQLAAAWQELEGRLQVAPPTDPLPGFVDRWEMRLEAERRQLYRRQSLAWLGFSLSAAALAFGSLVILSLPYLRTPQVLLWAWLSRVLQMASYASLVQELFSTLLRAASGTIHPVGWILIAGILCQLGVIWFVSVRVLTNPRRVK